MIFSCLWSSEVVTNKEAHNLFMLLCLFDRVVGPYNMRIVLSLKPGVGNRPVVTYATPEPGRLGCVISIEIGVNGAAYPAAVGQKVTKNLPVFFYSPTSGFNTLTYIMFLYHRSGQIGRNDNIHQLSSEI